MASLSKREQARNERELQDLVRQPGTSTCADCGARNPSWASWSLGIFLCMRCASIHRKLGTHISKVKSLSMDKWTADQVESMKSHGNVASNKLYNPRNKKPDIPLDADEVDSAMERFIRKKYQEKSLVDGRPEPPSRADVSPSVIQAPPPPPSAELPPTGKKHKFFGFSLRTSSKKDRAGAQDAFRITPVEYSPTGAVREVPEHELQEKIGQLRDMGFTDNERNTSVLKRCGGDLERSVAMLVRLGPSEPPRQQSTSPVPRLDTTAAASSSAPPTASISNNPFDQIRREEAQQSGFGLSFDKPQPQQPLSAQPSGNPWQSAISSRQNTGLEQQFAGMQVSNPLFPHNTGGYTSQTSYQQDPRLQAMTPPVPQIPRQFGYTASPTAASNPSQQAPMSSQSTGNNPFLQQQQSQPVFAPQGNPFMGIQQPQSQAAVSNPFGLPPAQSPPQTQQYLASPQSQGSNPFDFAQSQMSPSLQQAQQAQSYQMQSAHAGQVQSPQAQIPNFNYGQPQQMQQPQQISQQQQSQYGPMSPSQPQQPSQQQFSYQGQPFQQAQGQPQPQQLAPQATGRYTKTDIMALFSQPMQQQQLASINEDSQAQSYGQSQQQSQPQAQIYMQNTQQPQQYFSPAPTGNPYGAINASSAKRSVTLPAAMHSSSPASHSTGSKNPFLSSAATSRSPSGTSVASTPLQQTAQWQSQLHPQSQQAYGQNMGGWNQGARHASNESVSVNNPALMDGRHSPDAFAGLSARY